MDDLFQLSIRCGGLEIEVQQPIGLQCHSGAYGVLMDAGGVAGAQVVELTEVGGFQGLLSLESFQVFGYPVEVLFDESDGFG